MKKLFLSSLLCPLLLCHAGGMAPDQASATASLGRAIRQTFEDGHCDHVAATRLEADELTRITSVVPIGPFASPNE